MKQAASVFFLAVLMPGVAALSSDIKTDEAVTFFPTFGHLADDKLAWIISIHGWIYEPEEDSAARDAALAVFRRSIGLTSEEARSDLFQRRARLFLVDDERGKRIPIRLGKNQYDVGESEANGHFEGEVRLTDEEMKALRTADGRIPFHAVTRPEDHRVFSGQAQLVGETGISVISDIDDTIKISEVFDRKALLRNTFLKEFQAVSGMARVYQRWAKAGASFHYVSASPWQLYEPLAEFIRTNEYPPGSFHLKLFRWKDRTFLSLFDSPEETKLEAIEPILRTLPRRRFILVGDSGEKDPEIYGDAARKHPQQVLHVFLRNVTGEGREAERFRMAFRDVSADHWTIFANPEQMESVRLVVP